jgi:acyl-CoA synthetase (AMP-forming)/AMP-acid ligase II
VAPDSTAVLQYTSGSTADPRGVLLSHASLLHNSGLIQQLFRTTPESRGLIWLPPYHDMGLVGGLLQPLYAGFPIILMSPLHFLEQPMRWLRAIDRFGATVSGGPNFAYHLCARKCDPDQAAQLDLTSWRVAFNGAEPIQPETLKPFAATFAPSGFRSDAFLPCYGLAEATLIVSGHGGCRSADGTDPADRAGRTDAAGYTEPTGQVIPTVPVDRAALERHRVAPPATGPVAHLTDCGPSAPGQRIVIVDPETSTICVPDRVGEIWVSGPSVADGYWRKPDETERVFRAWLAGRTDGPFLRTGDLGFLSDGHLVITGRLKDLIIIRGQNHYPQDIELTAERADPVLRPGCTVAFLLSDADHLVLVHEVRRGSEAVGVSDVAARIRQAVAEEHGLEVRTVVLVRAGSIPKTSSGKVQRQLCRTRYLCGELSEVCRVESQPRSANPDPDARWARPEQVLGAPPGQRATFLESYLRGQLMMVSGTQPADRRQALLAIGLDSLVVVQLKYRVDSELAVSLSLAAMLAGASLADLVEQLDEQLGGPDRASAGEPGRRTCWRPDRGGGPAEIAPLSLGQRWMWYQQTLEPDSTANTIAVALRLLDRMDGTALHRALDALVSRHPVLRTTFQIRDGEPVQVVAPRGSVAYREHNAHQIDDATLRTVLTRVARTPFDLASGPLLRVDLYRCLAGDVLLLSVHHIITDFWSLTILARELGECYDAYTTGREPELPPSAATYADAVAWQRSMLGDPTTAARLSGYWDSQVRDGVPRLALPPAGSAGSDGGSRHFVVPAALASRLRAQATGANVTLYVLLLAAFETLLHRYTGQEELVVGAGVAGRTRAEFADVVGCFGSPVIVRSRLVAGESFLALLARTRDQVIGALEHQDYSMMMLATRGKIARRGPLFDVLFTFNRSPQHGDDLAALAGVGPAGVRRSLGPLRVETFPLPSAPSPVRLELMMAEVSDVPHGVLRYRPGALDAAAADRLVEQFVAVLELVAAEPGQPVGELVSSV